MGTTPLPTNSAATEVNNVISAVNSAGVQVVMNLAIADQPWLGAPVVKTLFGWLLGWLDQYLSRAEQEGATFVVIDVQVAEEESALQKAWAALVAAQKSGDKNAIKIALQNYNNAHSALIHDDGSASPST